MTIANSLHAAPAVREYLKECYEGKRLESKGPVACTDDECRKLQCNMDYALLSGQGLRDDGAQAEIDASIRREQTIIRIRIGNNLQRLLLALLEDKYSESMEALENLKRIPVGYQNGKILWSQGICEGSVTFQNFLWRTSLSVLSISSYWIRLKEMRGDEAADARKAFDHAASETINLLLEMETSLLSDVVPRRLPFPQLHGEEGTSTGNIGVTPLRPVWIQQVSAFRFTLGSWGPIIGSFLLGPYDSTEEAHKNKKKSKKKENKTENSKNEAMLEDFRKLKACFETLARIMGN